MNLNNYIKSEISEQIIERKTKIQEYSDNIKSRLTKIIHELEAKNDMVCTKCFKLIFNVK